MNDSDLGGKCHNPHNQLYNLHFSHKMSKKTSNHLLIEHFEIFFENV